MISLAIASLPKAERYITLSTVVPQYIRDGCNSELLSYCTQPSDLLSKTRL
jgi:hypothetical protein